MKEIQAIKPGPKPKKEDGTYDERRRVTPEKRINILLSNLTTIKKVTVNNKIVSMRQKPLQVGCPKEIKKVLAYL